MDSQEFWGSWVTGWMIGWLVALVIVAIASYWWLYYRTQNKLRKELRKEIEDRFQVMLSSSSYRRQLPASGPDWKTTGDPYYSDRIHLQELILTTLTERRAAQAIHHIANEGMVKQRVELDQKHTQINETVAGIQRELTIQRQLVDGVARRNDETADLMTQTYAEFNKTRELIQDLSLALLRDDSIDPEVKDKLAEVAKAVKL